MRCTCRGPHECPRHLAAIEAAEHDREHGAEPLDPYAADLEAARVHGAAA